MTAGLNMQAGPYQSLLKMLTPFAHVISIQCWTTFFYKAHRIAAGMGVDAMEDRFHRES
jgi:hypothetical protein